MADGVPVLMYHHINEHAGDTVTVTPEVFAGQIQFLAGAGYTTLTLSELLEFIRGEKPVADRSIVITFDDGWLDNYLFAYPVLLKYRFRSASFLITARTNAATVVSLPERVPCHAEAKQLLHEGEAGRVVMDWKIVRQLQREGYAEFHSHTLTHRRATRLTPADLAAELVLSKAMVESELGSRCSFLCWPYGDCNAATAAAALAAGYTALFTTEDGFNRVGSDPCRIRRIEVQDSVAWLQQRLEGDL